MSLTNLFEPKSIAVIGASSKVGSVGNDVLKNLLTQGYKGKVYPINPKTDKIYNTRCFDSINSLPEVVDLAIVIIPASSVPQVLEEIGQKGVKAVIVISAGFKEIGENGVTLENQVKEIAQKYKIKLLGVNCLGLMNTSVSLNASFASSLPPRGNISFIAQSGALCTAVIDYAQNLGLGFSKFVSIGNKTSLSEIELLEYLEQDEDTKVILMYLEDIVDGQEFLKKSKYLTKPIVVLKSGRTVAGAKAASSHTGALGGADTVYEVLFRQAGIIRAENIFDLFNYGLAFAHNPLLKGKNIAIITNAGGPGSITTDALAMSGLEMAQLSTETINQLKEVLPVAAGLHNPVDVLGDAKSDRYKVALEIVLNDPAVDGSLVILTPQSMTEIDTTARLVANAKNQIDKPILASFMGLDTVSGGNRILQQQNVAAIPYPDMAARSMSVLWQKTQYNNKKSTPLSYQSNQKDIVQKIIDSFIKKDIHQIPEYQAQEILKAYELPVLKTKMAKTAKEAQEMALNIGEKVVLKIVSPDIIHKSDVGGVYVGVASNQVFEAFEKMIKTVSKNAPEAHIEGVLVSELAPKDGLEMILGLSSQPQLGSAIMLGSGGIFVEAIQDVTFALTPLTTEELPEMINRIKIGKILKGYRGQEEYDISSLYDCITKLNQLAIDFPQIKQLDINPFLILRKNQGCRVLDARITV